MKRREFVQKAVAGLATATIPFTGNVKAQEKGSSNVVVQYRGLGKTGMKVSVVGFGAMRTSDPNVIHHALDKGVNYIDTAHCYMNGNNEVIVGNVLKTRRKEVFVATKCHINSEEEMLKSAEASLKSLQTDYVDIMQLHSMKSADQVLNETAMKALDKMKQKGMTRFVGFTTHKNQVECIEAGIKAKFYDTILVTYSFKTDPAIEEAIERAVKAGIGIIAMKTQAGGYKKDDRGDWSPHQAALRWVLKNPNISTAIPSMVTFDQVDENVGAMRSSFGFQDQKILERYSHLFDCEICRMCGSCESNCVYHLPIQDINRALMYAEGYRDYDMAIRTYREIAKNTTVNVCYSCADCTTSCKYQLEIPKRMKKAFDLFKSSLV